MNYVGNAAPTCTFYTSNPAPGEFNLNTAPYIIYPVNANAALVSRINQFRTGSSSLDLSANKLRQVAYGTGANQIYSRVSEAVTSSTTTTTLRWGSWYRITGGMELLWTGDAAWSGTYVPQSHKYKCIRVFYGSANDTSSTDPIACSYVDIPNTEGGGINFNRTFLTYIKTSGGSFVGEYAIQVYVDTSDNLQLGSRVLISGTAYTPSLRLYAVYGIN